MFEKALRKKYRFQTPKGLITVESLWELPLEGDTSLDAVARSLHKGIEDAKAGSFVRTSTPETTELDDKMLIVKHIIQVRLQEREDRLNEKARQDKIRKIEAALEERRESDLKGKSEEELLKELATLRK